MPRAVVQTCYTDRGYLTHTTALHVMRWLWRGSGKGERGCFVRWLTSLQQLLPICASLCWSGEKNAVRGFASHHHAVNYYTGDYRMPVKFPPGSRRVERKWWYLSIRGEMARGGRGWDKKNCKTFSADLLVHFCFQASASLQVSSEVMLNVYSNLEGKMTRDKMEWKKQRFCTS